MACIRLWPFHGFVHVESVQAGIVEAGEPHVAHDYQLQRVLGVDEAGLDVAALALRG